MTPEAQKIHDDAVAAALEYGYTADSSNIAWRNLTPELRAPLGKFEGEPYYALYFYNAALVGDGEPFGDDGHTELDVFQATDDERAAFGLDDGTAYVVLHYSESGFVSLEEITAQHYADLVNAYTNAEETEQE